MVKRKFIKDARLLTCPFIQHSGLVLASITVKKGDSKAFKDKHWPSNIDCITKDCMAWGCIDDESGFCKLVDKPE